MGGRPRPADLALAGDAHGRAFGPRDQDFPGGAVAARMASPPVRPAGNAVCPGGLRPAVTRSRLLLGVASVLAGAAALFVVLGAVFNLLLLAVAVPFAAAAYFLWSHATGRLEARVRWYPVEDAPGAREARRRARAEARQRGPAPPGGAWRTRSGRSRVAGDRAGAEAGRADGPSMDRREALATLGLAEGADQAAVRRAFRERVKAVHPDADGGDETAFRQVTAAYERLRER